jgi:hypothetical protein
MIALRKQIIQMDQIFIQTTIMQVKISSFFDLDGSCEPDLVDYLLGAGIHNIKKKRYLISLSFSELRLL